MCVGHGLVRNAGTVARPRCDGRQWLECRRKPSVRLADMSVTVVVVVSKECGAVGERGTTEPALGEGEWVVIVIISSRNEREVVVVGK